jgi:kynurenine formamidase
VDRAACQERYNTPPREGDRVITAAALRGALQGADRGWCRGLVVRTLSGSQAAVNHSGSNPPFFTLDAMKFIREQGVQHLLVDLPSVDREEDDGMLEAHHIFWGVPSGQHACDDPRPGHGRTITEMVKVEGRICDGPFLLQIHIPSFCLDVAPSRPILYPVSLMETEA